MKKYSFKVIIYTPDKLKKNDLRNYLDTILFDKWGGNIARSSVYNLKENCRKTKKQLKAMFDKFINSKRFLNAEEETQEFLSWREKFEFNKNYTKEDISYLSVLYYQD